MTITILGLGPGDPAHLTRQAWQVLNEADEIYLRTARHPTVAHLPDHLAQHAFDHLYEREGDFGAVYTAIASQVLELGRRPQGILYAVPGHPLVGEASVDRILDAAREASVAVRIVAGLSFVEPVLNCLGIDALNGLQLVDATDLAALHHPPLNPDLPALIAQLYSRALAADVKLTLMNQYPAEHPVVLVHSAGTPQEQRLGFPLYELDRRDDLAHLSTLYLPPLPQTSGLESFQETIARLRAPGGCPWDREQTHESLRKNLLEEAYEVLAAIDALETDGPEKLCEELGDLLLQVVLHSQIAVEAGEFSLADVVAGVDAKIKHRHPHVWGDQVVSGAEQVIQNWEAIKREERAEQKGREGSIFDGVPAALPALTQAYTYGQRAARVGFDWPSGAGVVTKIEEELAELAAAASPAERQAELGDLLFALVNWARWLNLDPEVALRQTNVRFARRFAALEAAARQGNVDLKRLSPDELRAMWQAAKDQTEKAPRDT